MSSPPVNASKRCVLTVDGYSYLIGEEGGVSRAAAPDSPGSRRALVCTEQGSMTVVRRSGRRSPARQAASQDDEEETIDSVDLSSENLPAVDTPDACDKAALRLRGLLGQLRHGEVSAEILQKNLRYAAQVLEAVYIDETKAMSRRDAEERANEGSVEARPQTTLGELQKLMQRRRLRKPVWATNRSLGLSV